jgi:hypothetical protein
LIIILWINQSEASAAAAAYGKLKRSEAQISP